MIKMDFALARLNHQVWKMRLRAFLNDREEVTEKEAVSHTDCDLGKWIYSEGLKNFNHIPEMQRLEAVHTDLHHAIKDIVRYKNQGDPAKANEAFKNVGPLSKDIVNLLTTLEQRVKSMEQVS